MDYEKDFDDDYPFGFSFWMCMDSCPASTSRGYQCSCWQD
jgi:hypothetical protein